MTTSLTGWKEIARYVGRGIRTVQRWEELGLPVHRPQGRQRSSVLAIPEELDAWMAKTPVHLADVIADLKVQLRALQQEVESLKLVRKRTRTKSTAA